MRACARQSACAAGCRRLLHRSSSSSSGGGRTRDGGGLGRTSQVAVGVPAGRHRESAATQRAANNWKRTAANKSLFRPFVRFFFLSCVCYVTFSFPSISSSVSRARLSVNLSPSRVCVCGPSAPPFYSTTRDTRAGASLSVSALAALVALAHLRRFVDWSCDGAGGVYENVV